MSRSYLQIVREIGAATMRWIDMCEGSKERKSRVYSRNWKPASGQRTGRKLWNLMKGALYSVVY